MLGYILTGVYADLSNIDVFKRYNYLTVNLDSARLCAFLQNSTTGQSVADHLKFIDVININFHNGWAMSIEKGSRIRLWKEESQ